MPGVRAGVRTLSLDIPGAFADGFLDGTGFMQGERDGYPALLSEVFDDTTWVRRGRGSLTRLVFPLDHPDTIECLTDVRQFAETLIGISPERIEPELRAEFNAAKTTVARCDHAIAIVRQHLSTQNPGAPAESE